MADALSFALSLAPELAQVLADPANDAIAEQVKKAIQTVTGTTELAAAEQVLSRDPQTAIALRARLAQIAAAAEQAMRQREHQELVTLLSASAPAASTAQRRTGDQWGAPVVSIVVLATFACVMWAAMTRALPAGSETMVNLLLGTLAAMATSVVAYWVGSSAGSAAKTDLLFRARPSPPGTS